MRVDRWAGGRTCRGSGRAPCRVLSCSCLLSCPSVSGLRHARPRGSLLRSDWMGMPWAAHGQDRAAQDRTGQGSLAGPEGLSQRLRHLAWGRKRARWLLKPNNKALAQAQTQAQKPEPSSGVFGDGIGTRGDERVCAAWSGFNFVTIGVDERVVCMYTYCMLYKRNNETCRARCRRARCVEVGTVRQTLAGIQTRAGRAGQHSLIFVERHSKSRALSKAWAMHHNRTCTS